MSNYYTSSLAGGGGSGSELSPWTLAEAETQINLGTVGNGDTVWVKGDGIYPTSGITITSVGGYTPIPAFKSIYGYTNTIGDGGKATIQRSGGAGILIDFTVSYWRFENFILDGQDSGTVNLDLTYGNNVCRRIESKNAGTAGIHSGLVFNSCSYDNGSYGFDAVVGHSVVSANNGSIGYYNCSLFQFASYNDSQDAVRAFQGRNIMNGAIVGAGGHGIAQVYYGCVIKNISISDCTNNAINIDRDGAIIENMNFYNNGGISNEMSQLGTYYELDPQFTNPVIFDFTRTGTNLDDKGFSSLGCQSFDYHVDIGIDQKIKVDYPAETDVRDGVSYNNGGSEGNVKLPAIADVRLSEGYGANDTEYTGTLDLPSINDVENGVTFDNTTKTGNVVSPAESNVKTGVGYGTSGTEKTGSYDEDYPNINDVEDGVIFGNTVYEGNLEQASETDVRDGTGYGSSGTEKTGSMDLPSINDVEDGVFFDSNTKEGNFSAPATNKVISGIGYGSLDTEYTGILELIYGFRVNIRRLDDLSAFVSPLTKGDSCNIEVTINTDISDWKIRADFHDKSSNSVQLANTESGGATTQIEVTTTSLTSSTFTIKLPKNETTDFDDNGNLEVEVETDDTITKKFTILNKTIDFEDKEIDWETPS